MTTAEPMIAPLRMADIAQHVAAFYNVEVRNLKSPNRHRSYAYPRQVFMYLAKTYTHRTFAEISYFLGERHHTTVMHGVRAVGKCMAGEDRQGWPGLREEVAYLVKLLANMPPATGEAAA